MPVVTLAVDAMGGDHGLSVTVPAVAAMLSKRTVKPVPSAACAALTMRCPPLR